MLYIENNNNIIDINMYYNSIFDLINYIILKYEDLPLSIFFNRGSHNNDCKNTDDFIIDRDFMSWFNKNIEIKIDFSDFQYINLPIKICKKNILTRNLDFYKNLLSLYRKNYDDILEVYIEKSLYYIFNYHKLEILNDPDYIVVGSGLSGCVFSDMLSHTGKKILIIEKRNHIGGNCYDYIDEETNIRVSKYGAHIFHTNNDIVWKYVNKYSDWIPYFHKVYGKVDNKLVPIPINIKTINELCNQNIQSKEEMENYLELVRDKTILNPKNSEEYCLQKFGNELYEKIIKHYTKKQWDKYPNELDVSVLQRIPIRYDFSEGYFFDKYQGMPKEGYSKFISNIVDKNNILILYNTDFMDYKKIIKKDIKIIFTGPIDHFYKNLGYDKLEYRSINFNFTKIYNCKKYQENSVINYPSNEYAFTRIVEYKHFYENDSEHTIISKEFSTNNGDPYYPVPNEKNKKLYEKYKEMSNNEPNIIFCGRLASYKYYNMDEAILNSINMANDFISSI